MSDDPVFTAVQKFMDAVEERIGKQDAEVRSLRDQLVVRGPPETEIREFIRATVALAVTEAMGSEIQLMRELRGQLETMAEQQRSALLNVPQPKDGVDGKDGRDGIDGKDGTPGERGADGINGRDGTPGERGERGADGIASREELESIVEARFADLQVRSFADAYEGVWKEGLHKRGTFTTWGGSLWLALNDTENKPGENGDYRLVVKKGADAKR